jgi:hypothetical protein
MIFFEKSKIPNYKILTNNIINVEDTTIINKM